MDDYPMDDYDAATWWEQRYAERDRIWSGRPNARLVEFAAGLPPGRALDLGCGEGGDAVWLAARGWQVVATDIAAEAIRRASAAAERANVAHRIDFRRIDLAADFPAGPFDLVSAHFLQAPVEWDRGAVLRRAAATIAPTGTLLVVDHGAAPSWAEHLHDHRFPTVDEVLDGVALDAACWETVHAGPAEREATGPDGQHGTLVDNIIVLRRRPT
ncbi:class I SAM-dependent methyltransferase [Mycobacterium sp. MYCO198283]|uniref:class I SAM-dependent methyltransferase n=1 Tax=Mycobacterium sp. MYCO198283 TaxID=2883505 RepID=UPI001E4DCA85|nr:methyltransferase domain-containing protein [Mycobacterium sp. MYCO198283]MCG5432438.1 class I SAM-dependent methyltransferase [Mycobacterium sp. MYCO198283]